MTFYIVFSVLLFVFNVNAEDQWAPCQELMIPKKEECCKTIQSIHEDKETKCELKDNDYDGFMNCMYKEKGLLKGDEVDEKKVEEELNKMNEKYSNMKDISDGIKQFCHNMQYKGWPPKDQSLVMRHGVCAAVTSKMACKDWKDTDDCQKMKDTASECKLMLLAELQKEK